MSKLPKNWLESHKDGLLEFIYKSFQYRYAHGTVDGDDSPIGSEPSFKWEKGNWMYRDWFWGGEPFSGIIVISWRENPARDWVECWTMTVNGSLMPGLTPCQIEGAYNCLDAALKAASEECPYRGPLTFAIDDYRYSSGFAYDGRADRFAGLERITTFNDGTLYECHYRGQVINTLY